MLFRRPCYYDSFTCTADKCTDNCCIGWEICIDEETYGIYKNTCGTFGQRLRENITSDGEPSFILKGERCPFLNEKGLCDIIISMGEESLCQICRDHPRWFEWYGNEKEGGIGLSCEEGARLILSEKGFADYFESEVDDYPDEDFDEEGYRYLIKVREQIFDLLESPSLSVGEIFDNALSLAAEAEATLCGTKKEELMPFCFEKELEKALHILGKTEPIDSKWTAGYEKLKSSGVISFSLDEKEKEYLIRLFAYFIWRYFLTGVFDYRITEKIRFAVFSVTVIYALYKEKHEKSFDALLKSAVLYSKQMEYSGENLDIFFSHC